MRTFPSITSCWGSKSPSDLFPDFLRHRKISPSFTISQIQTGTLSVAISALHPSASFVISPARLPRSSFCMERQRSHRGHRVFLEIPARPPGSNIYSTANPGLRFGTQIKAIKALLCERTFASSQKACSCLRVHGADKRDGADEVTGGC